MLKYSRSSYLEVVGSPYADFEGCADDIKPTKCYIFMLVRGAIS